MFSLSALVIIAIFLLAYPLSGLEFVFLSFLTAIIFVILVFE